MVFWLSLGAVVIFAALGRSATDLLVQRPATAAIGAGIAAITALVVVPVRVTTRYRSSVANLTLVMADATARWVSVATTDADRGPADRASTLVRRRYHELRQLLPGVAFETNPLVQARSSLSSQSTYLTGLVAAFHVVSDAAVDDSESLRGERRAAVLGVWAVMERVSRFMVLVGWW
jgi:hypothetical protein